MLAPFHIRRLETAAEFDTLNGGNAEAICGDRVLDAVEHRFTDTYGHTNGRALDDGPYTVAIRAGFNDGVNHAPARPVVNDGEKLFSRCDDVLGCYRMHIPRNVVDAGRSSQVGANVNTRFFKKLFCNAARDAQRRGQTSREMPAARSILMPAEFHLGHIVRMAWTRNTTKGVVVGASSVGVADYGRQRRAARDVVDQASEKFRLVSLLARR